MERSEAHETRKKEQKQKALVILVLAAILASLSACAADRKMSMQQNTGGENAGETSDRSESLENQLEETNREEEEYNVFYLSHGGYRA